MLFVCLVLCVVVDRVLFFGVVRFCLLVVVVFVLLFVVGYLLFEVLLVDSCWCLFVMVGFCVWLFVVLR